MDKKQAAELLDVSPRSLERYTTQGKISVSYKHGKTGAEAVYDEAELHRFKAEIEGQTYAARPAVAPAENASQALATTIRATGLTEAVGAFRGELIDTLRSLRPGDQAGTPSVSIGEKIMLTLADAAALSSLSRNHLSEAIHAGKLKAKIIGRGWRIKRDDLDAYVKKL